MLVLLFIMGQEPEEDIFICRDCGGGPWPVSESVKDASRKRGIMERCYPCMRKRGDERRADPVQGEVQREKVRTAMRARRSADEADGVPLSSWKNLTPEQREIKRHEAKLRAREKRFAELGVTEVDYWALLEKQGGKCAICGRTDPGIPGREFFPWDHDHKTKKPRGLLCTQCNLAIAYFSENEETLLAAIAYLKYWIGKEEVA